MMRTKEMLAVLLLLLATAPVLAQEELPPPVDAGGEGVIVQIEQGQDGTIEVVPVDPDVMDVADEEPIPDDEPDFGEPVPAEQPPVTPPVTPRVAPTPRDPNAPPVSVTIPDRPANGQGMTMNFIDAPLSAVLQAMSEQLGLVIVDIARATGRVSITSRSPLSADDAIEALNTALKVNNLTAIRSGKTLRVIPLAEGKTSSIPVFYGNDPKKVPQSDALRTQVIPIRYAEADRITRDLSALVPAYAHLASNAASNTLIYTATGSDVRHLVEIVYALDKNIASVNEVRVYRLEYADASTVSSLIESTFSANNRNSRSSRQQFGGFRGRGMPNMGPQQQSTSATVQQQQVTASADTQTNSVVVSAPPELLTIIEGVIKDLDSNPTEEETIFVYSLTNAKAANLETVLQEIFDASSSTSSSRTSTRGGRTNRMQFPFGGNAGSTTTASVGDLSGKVTVVADEDTNSLLVRTAPRYFERVKSILKELDRPTRQVLIKVLIAEITLDDSLDLGAEFSVLNIKIGNGVGTIGTDFGLSSLSSGLVAQYTNVDFEATLRAMAQLGKLEILSRPYLLGSENQQASITVGEEVPYVTNSRVTDTGQTVNNIDYRDIGIILELTPYIGPDGMVILDVMQEISSRTGRTVAVSDDFNPEVYAKRSATTRVAVGNGRTVVIGGLMQDRITETVNKVPLLGDIPGIGAAFSRIQKTKAKTELLIFLCPQTALTPDELRKVTQRVKNSAELVTGAVERGAFNESLKELGCETLDAVPLESLTPIEPEQKESK